MKSSKLKQLIRENVTLILKEESYKKILLGRIEKCSLSNEEKQKLIADLENANNIPKVAAKLDQIEKGVNENIIEDEYTVKFSPKNETWWVLRNGEIVVDYVDGERATAEAKRLNALNVGKQVDKLNEDDGDKFSIGDKLTKDGKEGTITKVMDDMVNVDFGGGDVYGIMKTRIHGTNITEVDKLNESFNPEVYRDVNRYIARTAKRYDYSEQDAVFAIMAALKQREFDNVNEQDEPTKSDLENDSKLTINATKMGELAGELKTALNKWKNSEGAEKQEHLEDMKRLTKLKKELESTLNESVGHAEIRKAEKNLSSKNKQNLNKAVKSGNIKTSKDLSSWLESTLNENKDDKKAKLKKLENSYIKDEKELGHKITPKVRQEARAYAEKNI